MTEAGGWGTTKRTSRGRIFLSGSSSLETPAERALDRVVRSGQSASVLRLYLSRLQPNSLRPYHGRVARCLFDDAVQQGGGQVFACGNGDLALMAGPDAVASLGGVLLRLFRREAAGDRQLLGLWSLPADESVLRSEFAAASGEVLAGEEPPPPLGALAAIGALLAAAPGTDYVRRQRAVRIVGGRMSDLFHEVAVSFPVLEGRIGLSFSAGTDADLLRHVAAHMERRLLDALVEAELPAVTAFHVNLPVAATASANFAALQRAARRRDIRLGVEVASAEAVADPLAFGAMRDRLRAGGCTLVLDGVDHHRLLQIAPAALASDLLKLEWSASLLKLLPREQRALRRAVDGFGADRIVIDGADTEAALVWGRELGITGFQGRHVDLMLAAARLGICAHASACSMRQCLDRATAIDADGQAGCADPALLGGRLRWRPHQPATAVA